ncbi:hypothetical protein NL379_29945, partial [Klebsiella pneumoniae]|nr:hypothetical protein [Klebsiella pneumoniae]
QAVVLEQTKFNAWQTQQQTLTQCSAELEQVQKYLAQLQTKQSSLQQELVQAFKLNQLHIELNQAPEQMLLRLNELRQAAQTAIN